MAIRVVVGVPDPLTLAGLAAVLAQADDIEVAARAKDRPGLGEGVLTHQPHVVVVDAAMLTDIGPATWNN